MKRINYRNLAVLCFVALGAVWFYYQNQSTEFLVSKSSTYSFEGKVDLEEDENEGTENENPQKRLEYEFEMLKDPATGEIPPNIRKQELAFVKTIKGEEAGGLNMRSSAAGVSKVSAEPFVSFGPVNIGGRTRTLAIDVTDESIILAGGVSGGVWRTTDQGLSWTRTTDFSQIPSVTTIVQDKRPGNTSNWYYAAGEEIGNSASTPGAFYYGDGIRKSTDGGQNWTLLPGTTSNSIVTESRYSLVNKIAMDATNLVEAEVYVAGINEILRTTDDFQTVTAVLGASNTGDGNPTDVAVTSTGTVLAIISNNRGNGITPQEGLFVSADGITWEPIPLPSGWPARYGRTELSIDPQDENIFYALSSQFFYKHDRTMATWTNLTPNINLNAESVQGYDSQGGYNMVSAVHPTDQSTVFLGGTNLLRSPNGFSSETDRRHIGGYLGTGSAGRYLNHHPDVHAINFFPSDPDKMLNGTDGGVHITTNNKAASVGWRSLNNGYVTSQFFTASIFRADRGDDQLMGGMQDNSTWASFNGVASDPWQEVGGGDGSFGAFSYNALYLSAQQGQMFRAELVGNTYQTASNISPADTDGNEFLFINPFIVDRVNQDRVYVGGRGKIYYTYNIRTNPGEGEWNEINGTGITSQSVSAMASSVQPEGVLYFGTRNGRIQKIENTKDITSVANITRSNLPSGSITSVAVDPRDANRVFLTFGNYRVVSVWMSENGGDTWASISGNLEENANGNGNGPSVRSIEIMPNGTGEIVFVGTSAGLYMTRNLDGNNTNWTQQAPNVIGNVVVSMVQVRPIDGVVVAATHGSGMYKATYDVGFHPEINYSLIGETSAVIRANQSYIQGQTFAYKWFKDDVQIPGENSSELTVTETGTYKSEVRDQLGPITFTNEIALSFDVVLSVDDPLSVKAQVSPNPSQGIFNVNLNSAFATGFDFRIVSSNGNEVTVGNKGFHNTEEPFKVDLSNAPDGLYILNVTNSSRTEIIKLLKQTN